MNAKGTLALSALLLLLAACRQDMHDPPRYRPLAGSAFFADGRSARPVVEDTVARSELRTDKRYYTGQVDGKPIEEIPIQVDDAAVQRGRERFNIYCSPCHGGLGDGEGMVVQRGFRHPPSYHIDRLRNAPAGHFFDVITNGFGAMPSYASRVPVEDRWKIVAYIRALQLSQDATIDDVPAAERDRLAAMPQPAPGAIP